MSFIRKVLLVFIAIFSHAAAEEEVKICLVMPVKNDASVIKKCLESVSGVIDFLSIYDAGSSDETPRLIEQFMEDQDIPGKIHYPEWKSPANNLTLAVRSAKTMLEEMGISLSHTYLLVLDPNLFLIVEPDFRKDALDKDAYLCLTKSPVLSHYHYDMQLFRASFSWENIGTIYGHWFCKESYQTEKLTSLKMEEQEASSKEEKWREDLKLLSSALREEPDNRKYMFYLAQTNKRLKQYDDAISLYRARIKKEGSKEEVWLSQYMLGECYEERGEWDQALYWYFEAFQYNPDQPQPLRKIATYYRVQGKNDLSYLFAKHGSRLTPTENQTIFSHLSLHDYRFDEELSIATYYTRFKDEGYFASDEVLLKRNIPWVIKDQTYKNILFYVPTLKNAHLKPIQIDLPLVQEGFSERYHPMNPSIRKTANGYQLICRAVNYTQEGAKIFHTIDQWGIYRTRNFLVEYDADFRQISRQEIVENLPREKIRSCAVEGLEDCRIFSWNDENWFTCTTSDTNPTGERQISLGKIAEEGEEETIQVEKLIPLLGPDPYRCEKNWLPFIKDGFLHVIYSCDPFVIYRPDRESGVCERISAYLPRHDFSRFRGSAAPIPWDGGYLMLVHEVVQFADSTRCYLHRFLYLNEDFVIQKLSKPFIFQHKGVEFCLSMTTDHKEKKLVMAVGIEDREAYLCFVDLSTVRSLLGSLP